MTTITDDLQDTLASGEDSLWRAVLARDGSHGAFVYGVRSTGIYCRPTCPSRRPRREQVVFFASPRAAEQAHFRACRRCRPREGSGFDPQAELVKRVCGYIEANLEEPLTLAALSGHVNISPYHLQRTFKRIVGITPHQYARARRLSTLKAQLREGRGVTTALYEAGYGSSSRLYEEAAAGLGMTPATYRRGGQGMRIGYTIVDCPLGRLLVAATDRGICAVSLGGAGGGLEAALVAEYPAAEIRRDDGGLAEWVNALLRHLNGDQPDLRLPLDVQATASRGECGSNCGLSPTATSAPTGRSPGPWDAPRRRGLSAVPAPRTRCRWSSLATGLWDKTAPSPGIAGVWNESVYCWNESALSPPSHPAHPERVEG